MNCNPNQNGNSRRQGARAFTLIEMIGVLAVIAILASLLIPKVFSAISQARVNGVTVSTDTIKTALVDHYGRYGNFDQLNGTDMTTLGAPISGIVTNYDRLILMTEGLLDKPYFAAIAQSATIEICSVGNECGDFQGYALDGVTNQTGSATYIIEAKLMNVPVQDAIDLNNRIDGPSLGAANSSLRDKAGRVEYDAPNNGVVANLYIYLTSR